MLTLFAVAAPAEARTTQTPAERAREIAAALARDPLYIDPAYASALPETMRADVRNKAKALGYPVYSVVLPLTPSDAFEGKESTVLTLVIDALRRPGLYVVVDGGSRFPWYEVNELPQLDEQRLSATRERALDDTGYDAGPTEVLARMYELLALPALPAATPTSTDRGDRRTGDEDHEDAGTPGWVVALGIVVAGLVLLVALGLLIGLLRGGGGRPRGGTGPRREKAFNIPSHVAATVAAERRRRLTRETTAELTRLGSELAALPEATGEGVRHQQAALDAHDAAGRVLDSSEDLVDVVGAMVLLDQARREYDQAVAVAAGRKADEVQGLCAFNPLHGRSLGRPTQVEDGGTTLTLPLCADCRRALERGTAPASLPGEDGPYWHGDDLWAQTFFGNIGEDLASAVARGEHRS
ncbi:hypothetical protein [Kribbella caucasensis]|uniref:hypothetical protein n=1 Tax=Kribbella caucasensis TaxID=2512215 RepID=UPI001EE08AE5|nr:hypothetical protein [Kribbella sp. VKM Ac-2527]